MIETEKSKKITIAFFCIAIGFMVLFLVCAGCSTISTVTNTLKNTAVPNMQTAMVIQQNPTVLTDPHTTQTPVPTVGANQTATPTQTKPKFVYV